MESEENENLEELEQQLYAQVFHDSNIEEIPEIVTDNTATSSNRASNMRYWQNPKSSNNNNKSNFKQKQNFKKSDYPRKSFNKAEKNKNIQQDESQIDENADKSNALKRVFIPYTSMLSFMNPVQQVVPEETNKDDASNPEKLKSYEKKKTKLTKFPKEKGKFLKPPKKLVQLKYEEKKTKAEAVRKKVNENNNKKPIVIEIATSSDDDDSVIHIENAPPPLINIDSSDDEQRRKTKRGASPSTSSMVSDDFIVTGDKRRLINPFANPANQMTAISDKLKDVMNENEKVRKMKALTKVSSSSSNSNSARSSCERNVSDEKKSSSKSKKSKREKVCNSNDADDSIYSSKAMTSKKDKKTQSSSSSDGEDNSICVTAKDSKARRRKSTSSRKGKESGNEEDPKQRMSTSTPLAHKKKRSRFITPNYNEEEFASLISTAIQADDEEMSDSINSSKAVIDVVEEKDEEMPPIENNSLKQTDSQTDCQIIEPIVPTFNVSDEDIAMNSDSDDSIKNVSNDIEYDLTLNIRKSEHTPHEFAEIEPNTSHAGHENRLNYLDCEVGWNDEMRYFYNECTMGRDFCITTIKNSMPNDSKLWRVNHADNSRLYSDNDRKIRCRNCNEFGHKERQCYRPRKKIICYMCGETGHRETRCPNSICLRCGKPNAIFTTMCGNCSKFTKKTCPLCHYKGHDIDQCPDKWRRYHSTTTNTDGAVLDITFQPNTRKFCSLCARSGHFAEHCSYINRMFHGLIKSSWFVISNKPSYPTNYSFNASKENEHVLQLITYMENYSFNFNLPSNCQFYPKFREVFLRHKEQLSIREMAVKKGKQKKRKDKRIDANKEKFDDKTDEKCSTSNSIQENFVSAHHHDDSNSNYSFSDFYKANANQTNDSGRKNSENNENQIISDRNNPETLSDYVPLVSSTNNAENSSNHQMIQSINQINDSQKVCDSKVMLTKEHATLLMSQKGQNLLFDLGERFDIVSQFRFDSVGNSICLTGLPINQQLFHNEMKEFLYRCGLYEYEKMIEKTTQIPKIICRIVSYLKSNFQSIKNATGIRETKQLLDKFTAAEKSLDHRKAVKCRKALNIIFLGHAELGDGAKHITELKKILFALEREVEVGNGEAPVDPKLRNQISVHIRYIFSAVDHSSLYGDYRKMFDEYRKVIMKRQNSKNTLNNTR